MGEVPQGGQRRAGGPDRVVLGGGGGLLRSGDVRPHPDPGTSEHGGGAYLPRRPHAGQCAADPSPRGSHVAHEDAQDPGGRAGRTDLGALLVFAVAVDAVRVGRADAGDLGSLGVQLRLEDDHADDPTAEGQLRAGEHDRLGHQEDRPGHTRLPGAAEEPEDGLAHGPAGGGRHGVPQQEEDVSLASNGADLSINNKMQKKTYINNTFYVLLSLVLLFMVLLAVYAHQWNKGIWDVPVIGTFHPFFFAVAIGVFVSFGISAKRFHDESTKKEEEDDKDKKPAVLKEASGMPSKCPEFYRSVLSSDGKMKTCIADPAFTRNAAGDKTCTLKREGGDDNADVYDIGNFNLDVNNMSTTTICDIRSVIPWSSASVLDETCRSDRIGKWECINKDTRVALKEPVTSTTLKDATSKCRAIAAKTVSADKVDAYVAQLF